MRLKGSITIYISLILTTVLFLISVISESARMNLVYAESKSFTYMAADSVMAEYGRQIYKDYGILLVWENSSVEEQIKKYIQANIKMADLNGIGGNFLKTDLLDVKIKDIWYLTDEGGKKFIEQVISYMKYAGVTETVGQLLKRHNKCRKENVDTKVNVTKVVGDETGNLSELVEKINSICKELTDTEDLESKQDTANQKIEKLNKNILSGVKKDRKVSEFFKEYKKLVKVLDQRANMIDSTIELCENYERKKAVFLKKNGYSVDNRDYINDNLKILDNIRDEIVKNKELDVLNFSEIHSQNINIIKMSLDKIHDIIKNLKSLTVQKISGKEEENKSIYKNATDFLKQQILSLVIDNVENLSNAAISNSNLPSQEASFNYKTSVSSKNKAIVALYSNIKFGNYLVPKENTVLKYEMEYILNGESSDRKNLEKTVEKMVAVRTGLNLSYLMTDKVKMAEISSVSASVSTAMGLPFLEPVIKGVLTTAWSMAEGVSDVKALLKGKKVSFIKNKSEWNTSLSGLKEECTTENRKGFDYQTYCEILFLIENSHNCVFRILDLIQENIKKKYNNNFLIRQCFTKVRFKADYNADPLFWAMPWSINLFNGNNGAYRYSIESEGKY